MQAIRYSYGECLSRSRVAGWDLEQFADIELDFSKPFLPEDLARTRYLPMLSERERLGLNQIRGYAYAYLFRFVEEYIVTLVGGLPADDETADRAEALKLFLEEEKKHQQLFLHFEREFQKGFPVECGVVGDMEETARVILSHSDLSVLLFTTMLEWTTQAHYLAYFNERDAPAIDDSFREMFRLHWVEEAQHARLDALESVRAAAVLDDDGRRAAIRECLGLCDALVGILHQQADHDVSSLERFAGRGLEPADREELLKFQKRSYAHTFVTLGLRNRHFRTVVKAVSTDGLQLVDSYMEGLDA